MPPIQLSLRERALLSRLARSPISAAEVDRDYVKKFVEHGLAVSQALRLTITTRGQIEVLRQRFRRMPAKQKALATDGDFVSKLEETFKNGKLRQLLDGSDVRSGTKNH